MTVNDIYNLSPGTRVLAACPEKAREALLESLCASMPQSFKTETELNRYAVASMDITPDQDPRAFSDLHGPCAKLVSAAGRRSRFRGLLLLDISGFRGGARDMRLKALGELLAMPDGLASECVTFIHGAETEQDLLRLADALDFDGSLVIKDRLAAEKRGLDELLADTGLTCETNAAQLLEDTLSQMSGCTDFNELKFLRSCGNREGVITADRITSLKNDPWSYINRARKTVKSPAHRLGFEA